MSPKTTRGKKERLFYIEFCANFLGKIGRADIVGRFGISDGAASKDLADYIKLAPKNLKYDFKTKSHLPTEHFESVFKFDVNQVLKALSTGGDILELVPTPFIPSAVAVNLSAPDINILAQVSRAINLKKIVKVTYWSLSSGETKRQLAPSAIVHNGLRWHIRAFDRRRKDFRDFVVTRTLSAKILEEDIREAESQERDESWNRILKLELVPHPINIKHPKAIEMDYGMSNGKLEVELRHAFAGYALRLWNVDCSENHILKENHYQLWLQNRNSIEGIDDLTLAPGIGL